MNYKCGKQYPLLEPTFTFFGLFEGNRFIHSYMSTTLKQLQLYSETDAYYPCRVDVLYREGIL